MKFISLKDASDRIFIRYYGAPPAVEPVPIPNPGGEYRFPAQELDRAAGPLESGKMYAIGARPGIGKTTVALDCAIFNAVETGRPVYFVSSEMNEQKVALHAASIIYGKIETNSGKRERCIKTWGIMRTLPIYIVTDWCHDDEPTIEHIHRTMIDKIRDSLIIFDSAQFFASSQGRRTGINAVKPFADEIQKIAEDCSSAVIATSHMPRCIDAKPDKMPETADIPEPLRLKSDCFIVLNRKSLFERETGPGFTAAVNNGNPEGDIMIDFPEIQCDRIGELI